MHNKKEPLKVKAEDERQLVTEIDGAEKTFYLNPIRTMWVDVEIATIFVGASGNVSIDYETREILTTAPFRIDLPKPRISGTASLGRSSIALMGNSATRSQVLNVSIHEYDYDEDAAFKKKQGLPPVKTAHLFHMEHDWEIGNKEGWELSLYVEQPMLAQLVEAVASKRVKTVKLGMRFSNIYSDDDWAPPSMSADWFTRPDERGSGVMNAPIGYLESCQIELEQADLRKPQDVYADEEQAVEPSQEPISQNAVALSKLSESVDAMSTTIKWVGGLIAGVLLVILFK